MNNSKNKTFCADKILSYFKCEWKVLVIITISGLIYNIGRMFEPWFEGKMAGCLIDILGGNKTFADMLVIVGAYVISIIIMQVLRYFKRFYVRRFANNVNRSMKKILYGSLVNKSRTGLQEEGTGNIMTKAILDVDDCAEGMRKFTTEIFDTGVVLIAYAAMLFYYDWRLALICMIFPPISYIIAEKMKVIIQRTGAAYKEQSGILSANTLDRAANAITYRVFGREKERQEAYETTLTAYEKSAVKANIWNSSMPTVYNVISMAGVIFIIYFGGKNVLQTGWKSWDIAAFTTFISCFAKLSKKSSSAAKLFNAVHKAQVSWKRIRPLMRVVDNKEDNNTYNIENVEVSHLNFAYPEGKNIINDLTFSAKKGQIIGVTGPVACGKSTLGKVFLCEYPYEGDIQIDGKALKDIDKIKRSGMVGYLGHDPELFNDTIENNILLGSEFDAKKYLKMVCLDKEVEGMEDGINTLVGNGGVRLSGGQAQRLALARTLCHKRPLMILDDPFSALDKDTEKKIYENLKQMAKDNIIILISHRLYMFPAMDKVIWLDSNGAASIGTHEEVAASVPEYRELFESQNV